MGRISYSGRLLREFTRFAREKKNYWIVPLVVLLGLIAIVIVGGQAASPLLYTLF